MVWTGDMINGNLGEIGRLIPRGPNIDDNPEGWEQFYVKDKRILSPNDPNLNLSYLLTYPEHAEPRFEVMLKGIGQSGEGIAWIKDKDYNYKVFIQNDELAKGDILTICIFGYNLRNNMTCYARKVDKNNLEESIEKERAIFWKEGWNRVHMSNKADAPF